MSPFLKKWKFAFEWLQSIISTNDSNHKLTPEEHRIIRGVIWAIISIIFIFFITIWIFWESKWFRFWLQAITGNWSPENSEAVGGFQFAVSVLFGIILNWLPLIAALGLFIKFIKPLVNDAVQREKESAAMSAAITAGKILSLTTNTQRQAVLSVIPSTEKELKDKVRKAFEQATSRWKNHLIEMIGESKANIVFSKMEEDIPGTENASPEYNIFNNEIS